MNLMNNRRSWLMVSTFLLLLHLIPPHGHAAEQLATEHTPSAIAGMELEKLISGEEAARIVNRMHRGEVATQANFIGHYQGGDRSAVYYASLYDSPDQAEEAMEAMAVVMKEEGHGFSHLMKRTENETAFYMALGQGQAHYFFARHIELVWFAVDIPVAEEAIMEIIAGGSRP
jgi:hypothetical protein